MVHNIDIEKRAKEQNNEKKTRHTDTKCVCVLEKEYKICMCIIYSLRRKPK